MTSDSSQNGPPGRRPPSRGARRFDEGDLWSDNPSATPASPTPPSPPRQQPRPTRPPESSAAAGAAAARPARPQPPAQQPLPPPPVDDYVYVDDAEEAYYDDEPSLMGNPYVLAAAVVFGAIVLAVIVVLFFGRGDGDTQSPGTTANTTRTPTATVEGQSSPNVTGLAARSIAIATVREGPALSHLELGLLQANQDVDVVGRNEEATWFQIVFPPGTQLTGWVPETALRLPDDVTSLVAVAEPTQVARPEVPTATTAPVEEDTPTPEPGSDGPDLAVFISSDCTPGSEMVVVVSNNGTEALEGEPIEVIVSNDGAVELQRSFEADMDPGASASLGPDELQGIVASPPLMAVQVTLTALDDVDPSNNIASCAVEGGRGGNNDDDDDNNVPPPIGTQGN